MRPRRNDEVRRRCLRKDIRVSNKDLVLSHHRHGRSLSTPTQWPDRPSHTGRSIGCIPRPERSDKSFRRHGQAPYSNSPRSCGTARPLSMAPYGFGAYLGGGVAYGVAPRELVCWEWPQCGTVCWNQPQCELICWEWPQCIGDLLAFATVRGRLLKLVTVTENPAHCGHS